MDRLRAHFFTSCVLGITLNIFYIPEGYASFWGEENVPLYRLVAGQIQEITQLAEVIGASKENLQLLETLNSGINQVTRTIESLDEIARRAQGLNPRGASRISDVTRQIEVLRQLRDDASEVLNLKIAIAENSVAQASLQSEHAYVMGQEMVKVGSDLSRESKTASPGRAAQISASANANNMLATGVELQTLSHIAELQALSLELQKTELKEREENKTRERNLYKARTKTTLRATQLGGET